MRKRAANAGALSTQFDAHIALSAATNLELSQHGQIAAPERIKAREVVRTKIEQTSVTRNQNWGCPKTRQDADGMAHVSTAQVSQRVTFSHTITQSLYTPCRYLE
jgi:hypothetical protein